MPGIDKIATITIAVKDQAEALQWFIEKLGFVKRMDLQGPGLRWLTIAPKNQSEVDFLLASWFPDRVGKNATCVVTTPDCRATYEELKDRGVKFSQTPQDRPYGVDSGFRDPSGNQFRLTQVREIVPA